MYFPTCIKILMCRTKRVAYTQRNHTIISKPIFPLLTTKHPDVESTASTPSLPADLEDAFVTEEKVGGLQVTVEYPVVMEMMNCSQQLPQECLHFT